jgi:hypothetical protein
MTPAQMLRVHCTALGFLAVILKDVKRDDQALRAKTIGRLIESFCAVTVPEALNLSEGSIAEGNDPASIDLIIDCYKIEMRNKEPITPPEDRASLLKIFDRLHQRQQRRRERHFYATGDNEAITNRILQLIEEEIKTDDGDK